MTAIAAFTDGSTVWMGGDSAAADAAHRHYLTLTATPKVFEVGPLVMGYTSSFAMGHALQHRLAVPPDLPASHELDALDRWMAVPFIDEVRRVQRDAGYMKTDCGREQGGQFIVGVRGQLYIVDDDFHALRQIARYSAVGSGETACLAALFIQDRLSGGQFSVPPKHMVHHALEAAQAFVTTVRGPFTVIEGGRA